ncbi:DNA primase [Campylobacter sp. MIT 12-5580]|uniref:DNA primase n=1 Tax=Campylobacter sp. MIT 12-5580 TaxID=2040651 RepID=UPI0010F9F2CE|nr:DNA primase [Campylobacter sp. MIT 12-5580]TKX29691.1 DNA primase [Campylobacter sp. MIT 12-5580]
MIEKQSLEQLKARADIVDIIAHYVEVKKQGASFVCVCPFHDDKSPSMHINSLKGFYHCFACKAGGDVFKFVQDFEHIDFQAAVEKVASWSNFALSYTHEKQENTKSLMHILPTLNAFYKQNLSKEKVALHYLYERKLSDEDIREFELGFAPNSNESLRLLQNENIDLQDALEAGAIKFHPEQKSYYASFIQRITFPIYDHKGLLIGFGGRSLDAKNPAKYVNSPQSKLFDKSRVFYALNLAKDAIAKSKEMIICEGYMDAIAFHKAGVKNAVAVLGTALSENHLPLIKRFEAKVILCFDSDEAGLKAAIRSALLLSTHKIDGKVIILEGGKDPADLVANGDKAKLIELLEAGVELGEFYIKELINAHSLSSALDKQLALEAVQKYCFELEPLVAQSYEPLVARLLGVKEEFIKLSKTRKPPKLQNEVSFAKASNAGLQINIAELEICKFLFENPQFHSLFYEISDERYFKHQVILKAILAQKGIEEASIRELLELNLKGLNDKTEFLCSIYKLHFSVLNSSKTLSQKAAFIKQILAFLDRDLLKIKKRLETSFDLFLEDLLRFLNQEQDENELIFILKNLQHFSKFSKDENLLKVIEAKISKHEVQVF